MDRRGAAQEHLHAQQLERHAHKYIYVGAKSYTTMAGLAARGRMAKGTAFRREAGADNRDDVIWDRRYKHRSAGLAGLYNSRDVIQMQVLISAGELSRDDVPSPPDPSDRSLSKRQWELRTAKYTSIMEGLQVHILYAF